LPSLFDRLILKLFEGQTADQLQHPRGWRMVLLCWRMDNGRFQDAYIGLVVAKATAKLVHENKKLDAAIRWAQGRNRFLKYPSLGGLIQ
jgi:hypothetical protein